jgi:hypothetical protein
MPLHLNLSTVHSYLAANLQSANLPCVVACELQPVNVSMPATASDLKIQLAESAPLLGVMAGILAEISSACMSTRITSEDSLFGSPCTHST